MTRAALLAAFATVLAACHTTRVVWSKPGADQAAVQGDLQACAEQAHVASADNPATSTSIDVSDATPRQVSCMLSRGWRLTPLPSS